MKTGINASGKPVLSLSVRDLVGFLLRNGSITGSSSRSYGDRLSEGKEIHSKFQRNAKEKNEYFISEAHLTVSVDFGGFLLEVSGFADGIALEGDLYRIYEIKSVKKLTDASKASDPLHTAQLKCYAYMLALSKKLDRVGTSLVYIPTNDDDPVYRDEEVTFGELSLFFKDLTERYYPFAKFALNRYLDGKEEFEKLSFPFPVFREGQRELIKAIYGAGKRGYNLFASAPTGIGKTISALYPALKLLKNDKIEKIFYITPKNSIKKQACDTLKLLQNNKPYLRSISIASKYHLCRFNDCISALGTHFSEGGASVGCDKAVGHYSRISEALKELFSLTYHISEEDILNISEKHKVCPFELTMDASEFCDIIICDYNYIFDPFVSFKRFNTKGRYLLLVDEAHNLPDRVMENYSASFSPSDLSYLIKNAKGVSQTLYKAARNVRDTLYRIKASAEESGNMIYFKQEDELYGDIYELYDALYLYMSRSPEVYFDSADITPLEDDKIREIYFICKRFISVSERFDNSSKKRYTFLCTENGGVKLYLVDPADTVHSISCEFRSAVYFSATLLPESYYFSMLGGTDSDLFLDLPSPFPQDNRLIMSVPLSVKYSDRSSTSMSLCKLINTAFNVKKGNYIIFFPSFEYMEQIHNVYKVRYPHDRTIIQKRNMKKHERDAFIAEFTQLTIGDTSLIGFAVLGGSFSEGIDLYGNALLGTIIVGVGLAPPNPESEARSALYTDLGLDGKELSYDMPGLNRVFQAAGRVIRSEDDRGFILLADTRYSDEKIKEQLVKDWNIKELSESSELKKALELFWDTDN